MTTPTHGAPVAGGFPPMTPERWRMVDAILQAALACGPERRTKFVDDACGSDGALRVEVASLLAAHLGATNDFLEQPAAAALGSPGLLLAARLEIALAGRYAIDREIARGGRDNGPLGNHEHPPRLNRQPYVVFTDEIERHLVWSPPR